MSGRGEDGNLPTVLVTGGAGFIGCALSRVLAPRAARFVALDNMHPQVHATRQRPPGLQAAAEFVVGDVTDRQVWATLLDGVRPDVVIHLAAETGTAQSLDFSTRHARVNVVGTTQMLDAFSRSGCRPSRILLAGSRAVYGEGRWSDINGSFRYPRHRGHAQLAAAEWDFPGLTALPSTVESTAPNPTSVYAVTKLAQEGILAAWCQAAGVPLDILRLQNVYGPGQSLTNDYTGIVALFSRIARAGKAIPLYEDGQMMRDFVHVDDVIAAFVAALDHPPAGTRILDVGSGLGSTIAGLAGLLARFYRAPLPVVTGDFRDGDVRHASCRIEETSRQIGWRPRRDLAAGLAELQEWIGEVQGPAVGE